VAMAVVGDIQLDRGKRGLQRRANPLYPVAHGNTFRNGCTSTRA
jgi:hypothetical protein